MSEQRRSAPPCPDAEQLAALVDGRLAADDRHAVVAHLNACDDCYEIWRDVAAESIAEDGPRSLAQHDRRRWLAGVGVIAAALVLTTWLWPWLRPAPAARALDDLVTAVGAARFTEARLSGGFEWGEAPSVVRGDPGELPVRIAQAALSATTVVDADPTPLAHRVAAAGYLALRRYDAAVQELERAAALAPDEALVRLDLGAALLERHRATGRQQDAAQALEAAEDAARLLPDDAAARFNRALALEANGRLEEAVEAWDAYLAIDTTSPWAAEADTRRAQVRSKIGGARLESLSDQTRDSLAQLAADQPWRLLDYIDRVALPAWVSAVETDATFPLEPAHAAALALRDAGRDRFPADLIDGLAALPPSDRRSAAAAQRLLYEARAAFDRSKYQQARMMALDAARHLRHLRLPAADAEMQAAFAWFFEEEREAALAAAERLRPEAEARGYLRLVARADYMAGLYLTGLVDLERGLDRYLRAAVMYERSGDRAQGAATESQMLMVARSAGQTEDAWQRATASVRLLNATASPRLRYLVMSNLQFHLVDSGLYRAAVPVTDRLQALVDAWNDPLYSADVALLQIGLYRRLADLAGVRRAADVARRHAQALTDDNTRAQYDHAIDFATARALHRTAPGEAIDALNRILERLATLDRPLQVAEARLMRGRAFAALGSATEAEADWRAGLDVVEAEQRLLETPAMAVPRADRQWDLYAALIGHYRADGIRSLEIAERARARALLTALPGSTMPEDLSQIAANLPPNLTVLAYAVLDAELARWTVTQDGIQLSVTALPPSGLGAAVEGLVEQVRARGSDEAGPDMGRLLLHGVSLRPGARVVVVPDGPLHRVPFAALRLADGRRLLEAADLSVSPSVTWLARHRPAVSPAGGPVLLIGYGGARPDAGLPHLPRVADEIRELQALYGATATSLVGADATADAVARLAGRHHIIHIAGHAMAHNSRPWDSQIFLAPDAGRAVLTVEDLRRVPLRPGSFVLLSACSTAAGTVYRGEGVVSLARPFLAAGASAVLASLWPVRDDDASRMMVAVHRELQHGATLTAALAAVQRAELRARPDRWQPWIVLGS